MKPPTSGPDVPDDPEDAHREALQERQEPRSPPYEWMTPLAKWGYVLAIGTLILMIAALDTRMGTELVTPGARLFGGMTILLLLHQAWFLMFYTRAAIEAPVVIPSRYRRDELSSEAGAGVLASVNVVFSLGLLFVLSLA